METVKIYTRELALETAKQSRLAKGDAEDAARMLRNRIARAGERKLVTIAFVAAERGDEEIAKEARERAGVPDDVDLKDVMEVVESRRESKSREYVELTSE